MNEERECVLHVTKRDFKTPKLKTAWHWKCGWWRLRVWLSYFGVWEENSLMHYRTVAEKHLKKCTDLVLPVPRHTREA